MDMYGVVDVLDLFLVHMVLVCGKLLVGDNFFFFTLYSV